MLSSDGIGSEYRRGVILGLTLAELLLILLFLFLMILSATLFEREESLAEAERSEAEIRDRLNEVIVTVLGEHHELPSGRPLSEAELAEPISAIGEMRQQHASVAEAMEDAQQYISTLESQRPLSDIEMARMLQENSQIPALLERLAAAQREISELRRDAAPQEAQALDASIAQARVRQLERQVAGLEAQIADHQSDMSPEERDMSQLRAENTQLRAALDHYGEDAESVFEAYELASQLQPETEPADLITRALDTYASVGDNGDLQEAAEQCFANSRQLQSQLEYVAGRCRGTVHPPCVMTDSGSRMAYNLEVTLTRNGFVINRGEAGNYRQLDWYAAIPEPEYGTELNMDQFLASTRPYFDVSRTRSPECRFFVIAYDRMGDAPRQLYQEFMENGVERHFYVARR